MYAMGENCKAGDPCSVCHTEFEVEGEVSRHCRASHPRFASALARKARLIGACTSPRVVWVGPVRWDCYSVA